MDDKQIVDLYWDRSETAISETSKKYGKYCGSIAYNILHSHEDCEECVNDTYIQVSCRPAVRNAEILRAAVLVSKPGQGNCL